MGVLQAELYDNEPLDQYRIIITELDNLFINYFGVTLPTRHALIDRDEGGRGGRGRSGDAYAC